MKQKVVIAIIATIVIVGGTIIYINNHKASAPGDMNEINSNSNTTDEITGDVPTDKPDNSGQPTSVTIAVSQQTAGSDVTIDNVFLEKPGFVVIHEVDSKGQPGKIIGSSGLLSIGAKQDLEVKATIVAGSKYIAMLHEDNGDKKFNASTDSPITINEKPVMTMFTVSQ